MVICYIECTICEATKSNDGSQQYLICRRYRDTERKDRKIQRKDGTYIRVDSPQTIVLLGDVLELWAPTSERDVFSQAYPFMATLMQVAKKSQEIIYVRGNHDQNMERYEGEFSPNLRVYKQYYTAALRTMESEPKNIVFLHGDEFIWGRTKGISSKIMGYFYRIVTDLFEGTRIAVLSVFLIAFVWYCILFYGQAIGDHYGFETSDYSRILGILRRQRDWGSMGHAWGKRFVEVRKH